MKLISRAKAFYFFALLLASFSAKAHNYFVSPTGTDSSTWRSIDQVNIANLYPGDTVLFQRGATFYGTLQTKTGVVYAAYGTGADPIITGFKNITAWDSVGGGIYEAPALKSTVVLINGKQYALGRYPNNEWLTITGVNGNTSVTTSTTLPNFAGGTVIIRKKQWVIDGNHITSNTNTVNYTPYPNSSATQYSPALGWGFFVQDHPYTLDQYGEWCNINGRLRVYFGDSAQPAQVAQLQNLAILKSNVTLIGLQFTGATGDALLLSGNDIKVINCAVSYVYNGIRTNTALKIARIQIIGNKITYCNNSGLYFYGNGGIDGLIASGNTFEYIGMIPGAGNFGDLGQTAMYCFGSNHTIEYNVINHVGYTGIRFDNSKNMMVRYNVIDSFCLIKNDGSGIYTWNNPTSNRVDGSNCIVYKNIVSNGIGNPAGSNSTKSEAYGIYMDDNSSGVIVDSNTVINAHFGIMNNNGHEIMYRGNLLYKSRGAALTLWNSKPGATVYKITAKGNIYWTPASGAANVQWWDAYKIPNTIKGFGAFTGNYFLNDKNRNVFWYEITGKKYYDFVNVASTKTYGTKNTSGSVVDRYNFESGSVGITGTGTLFYATDKPVTYKLSRTYRDHTGKSYSGSITIPAYSSKLLVY